VGARRPEHEIGGFSQKVKGLVRVFLAEGPSFRAPKTFPRIQELWLRFENACLAGRLKVLRSDSSVEEQGLGDMGLGPVCDRIFFSGLRGSFSHGGLGKNLGGMFPCRSFQKEKEKEQGENQRKITAIF
jgi:hypothetical protein